MELALLQTGVYLYCVGLAEQISPERLSSAGIAAVDTSANPLRLLHYEELVAVVSDTAHFHFDIERESLMAHHHALEALMKLGDILPVAYGTVADTDEAVTQSLLAGSADVLRANLEYVRGRIELSLRVMWKQDQLFQEIVDEFIEIRRLRDQVAHLPEDAGYNERIELGRMTSEAVQWKRETARDELLAVLTPICVDLQLGADSGDSMIMNGSFLVDKDRESEFDEAVQEIGRRFQDRMIFRYVGPLPPASFVSVSIPESAAQ
jgi:hypothetical protein